MKIIELLSNDLYKNKKVIEKIICFHTNKTKEKLFIDIEETVDETIISKIIFDYNLYENKKKPLEYIFGFVEFYGNKFKVNQDTLIPRPETEYMINAVNQYCKNLQNLSLIDLGTGCGVLGISVILNNFKKISNSFFTDLSSKALKVAKQNSEALIHDQTKINFLQSDLLEQFKNIDLNGKQIVLVANLPYIPEKTFDADVEESAKIWEPRMAFLGGEDGLDLYRKMLDQIIELKWGKCTGFLEMIGWQTDVLEKEYEKFFKFEVVDTFHCNIKIVKVLSN